MHELLFICISVSEIFGITQLRVSDILFAERQLCYILLAFFSFSVNIVLMLAHVFSVHFCGIRVCEPFLFFLFSFVIFNALTEWS